jgi:hypothetical protein
MQKKLARFVSDWRVSLVAAIGLLCLLSNLITAQKNIFPCIFSTLANL